jgi:hypothetical protein
MRAAHSAYGGAIRTQVVVRTIQAVDPRPIGFNDLSTTATSEERHDPDSKGRVRSGIEPDREAKAEQELLACWLAGKPDRWEGMEVSGLTYSAADQEEEACAAEQAVQKIHPSSGVPIKLGQRGFCRVKPPAQ